ncbi:endonuclease MutS2 [Paenibacillus guangzhouensis]|uniref:endonuclease MutS2 n=1 Tax=Paenibacillus guangzhouensis TaxID=1473112 RepID=UPI001266AC4F|nr:DNA mismatch repair protein MutS [Paenibacillus guangzhouensis]
MNQANLQRLEYVKVKELVAQHAASYLGRRHIEAMEPMTQLKLIRQKLDETAEAKEIIQSGGSVPIPSLEGLEHILDLMDTGYVFTEQDFMHIHTFLHSCAQLIKYMGTKAKIAPHFHAYATSMYELSALRTEIERCIRNGRVTDYASKDLAKVRKRIAVIEERLKSRLDALMSKHSSILQERIVSMRNDRYVLPIRREHRKLIKGTVLDESASGQTVFVEPADIAHIQHELAGYRAEEARIEAKILSDLTTYVEQYTYEIQVNVDTVGIYDFVFAKAKYAMTIDGRNVRLNDAGVLELIAARHPLLRHMVPLQFAIGRNYKSLIITGPNTGGKTLALKTVGLLTLMVQSGLLVPAAEESIFSVFDQVMVDIGDGQSIEHALSTFSAHIRHVIEILDVAGPGTLILIDEMASGTDPGEGVGLSIAILEELHRRGSTVVATTHFTEIKNFASVTPGFENARMAFDPETLQPAYRLIIGEAGQSYAFLIAKKLGLPEAIIARSRDITSQGVTEPLPSEVLKSKATESSARHVTIDLPNQHQRKEGVVELQGESRDKDRESGSNEEHDHPCSETEEVPSPPRPLQLGDRVRIPYLDRTGVIYETEDAKGIIGVMIQKQKLKINKKRVELYIEAKDLYGEDYDLSIVLDSKENRKKRKLMHRKHVEGLRIEMSPEE